MSDFPISAAHWPAPARPLVAPPHRRSVVARFASIPRRLQHSAQLAAAGQTAQDFSALVRFASRQLDTDVLGLAKPAEAAVVTLRGDITVDASVAARHLHAYRQVFLDQRWGRVAGFRARPGQTVIDAGAGAGFYALWQARAVGSLGRVIAIESGAEAFADLADNVARNDMTWIRTAAGMQGAATRTLDSIVACDAMSSIDVLRVPAGEALGLLIGGLRLALPLTQRVVIEGADDATCELLTTNGFTLRRHPQAPGVHYFGRA